MQKYSYITELYACILKIFVVIFLIPINFVISFVIYSTPTLSKYVTAYVFRYKAIQSVLTELYVSFDKLSRILYFR